MTCIAAFTDEYGVTAIACDTAMTGPYRATCPTKIFAVGPMWVGVAGQTTWHRFLRECVAATPGELADAWNRWARERGHGEVSRGTWGLQAEALCVAPGVFSEVFPCGSVESPADGYSALGSGAEVAIGVLWFARRHQMRAADAVRNAVLAAIAHAQGCGGEAVVQLVG